MARDPETLANAHHEPVQLIGVASGVHDLGVQSGENRHLGRFIQPLVSWPLMASPSALQSTMSVRYGAHAQKSPQGANSPREKEKDNVSRICFLAAG